MGLAMYRRRYDRMADPQYLFLDAAYEAKHRAGRIADGKDLPPLRGHTHTQHLSWDERYAPFIREAGLLHLARVVTSRLPSLDPALLTALVDQVRDPHFPHAVRGEDHHPARHSDDLRASPLTASLRTSGVTTGWLCNHFGVCPPDAEPVEVERHARAWLWFLLACFLLPDSSGDTVDSALLPILDRPWAAIATFS
ncbi:LOW QUALITY PROTEIN: hypothetical protein U9M48_038560 [Paspalum notatum var. saurae]|uniref:Aminotransferase-like plant mobile domain-containing protein n=1 Tax=Paspalum notatum var. saurae TaxID=547442 RepID=A0AAQ3XC68_PASNO